jgi:NTE family protein
VIKHFSAEKVKTRAWRRILEQTTGTLLRQSAGD